MSAIQRFWWITFFWCSVIFVGIECFEETLFQKQKGKYLPNHVIETKHADSEIGCSMFCAREESCKSVNYKHAGDNQGLCELNNASSGLEGLAQEGLLERDFNYLGVIKRNCEERKQVFSQNSKKCVDVGSCKEVLKEDGSLSSGIYYLKELSDSSAKKYPVYCHMSNIVNCGGGAWTLVLKMNGSKSTFKYDSPYWSDKNTYGYHEGLEGLTDQESKLASYWITPFKKICLGMKVEGVTKWVKLDYEASSLHSVIANGTFRETTAGRSTWKALIDDSSLQMGCNREGFNVRYSTISGTAIYLNLRLGIITNDQNNCINPDSYIGFGVSAYICGISASVTCGNMALCGGNDNGLKTTAAIGYILVE